MVESGLRLSWRARLLGCLLAGCSQPVGPNPGPTPPPQPLTELLPTGMAHTSPHEQSLLLTLPAHCAHTGITPNTGITPKYQHHPQTPVSPPNTSITPKYQHHPQTPASPHTRITEMGTAEDPHKLRMHLRCCLTAPHRQRLPRSIF